jgi:hypothetical protein
MLLSWRRMTPEATSYIPQSQHPDMPPDPAYSERTGPPSGNLSILHYRCCVMISALQRSMAKVIFALIL